MTLLTGMQAVQPISYFLKAVFSSSLRPHTLDRHGNSARHVIGHLSVPFIATKCSPSEERQLGTSFTTSFIATKCWPASAEAIAGEALSY